MGTSKTHLSIGTLLWVCLPPAQPCELINVGVLWLLMGSCGQIHGGNVKCLNGGTRHTDCTGSLEGDEKCLDFQQWLPRCRLSTLTAFLPSPPALLPLYHLDPCLPQTQSEIIECLWLVGTLNPIWTQPPAVCWLPPTRSDCPHPIQPSLENL